MQVSFPINKNFVKPTGGGSSSLPMPPKMQQAKNFVSAMFNTAKVAVTTGRIEADEKVKQAREAICTAPCEFYNPEQGRCSTCGCWKSFKIWLYASECPKGKW